MKFILAIFLACFAVASAQDNPPLEYRVVEKGDVRMHVITLDPKKHTIHLVRAMDQTVGQELLSHMLKRKKGIAAINGTFFKSGGRLSGEESYITFYNGKFEKIFPGDVSVFGVIDGSYHTDIVHVQCFVQGPTCMKGKSYRVPVDAVNTGEGHPVVVYTDAYHRSTLTIPGRLEVSVDKDGMILAINSKGTTPIPVGGYVFSFSREAWRHHGSFFVKGTRTYMMHTFTSQKNLSWDRSQFLIAGVPTLLQNGDLKPVTQCKSKDFVEGKHARTAVGVRGDGQVILLHVEGNSEDMDVSFKDVLVRLKKAGHTQDTVRGLTMDEVARFLQKDVKGPGVSLKKLAQLLKGLDCKDAINLDGGRFSGICFGNTCPTRDPLVSNALIVSPS